MNEAWKIVAVFGTMFFVIGCIGIAFIKHEINKGNIEITKEKDYE